MMRRIWTKAREEPLAVVGLMLTALLAILGSEWFKEAVSGKVAVRSVHQLVEDGRCSVVAFTIQNDSNKLARSIVIRLTGDWRELRGDSSFDVLSRTGALIARGSLTPLPQRIDMQVPFRFDEKSRTVTISSLAPREYMDFFVARYASTEIADQRKEEIRTDKFYFKTPRIISAFHDDGGIRLTEDIQCS